MLSTSNSFSEIEDDSDFGIGNLEKSGGKTKGFFFFN